MASVPEPTPPFEVRAIASFAARSANEMSIEAGKVYKVIQTDGKGLWWNTQGPNGNYGWFPANYVEVISTSSVVPPSQPQAQQTSTTSTQTTSYGSSVPPTPLKLHKDKGASHINVQIHIVTARGLKTDTSLVCHLYLYHIINDKEKDGRVVHKSAKIKKSKAPEWNEKFEVNVNDPELECIRVRLLSKQKKVGEVIVALRATVRTVFTAPNFEYKWHKLQGGGDGEVNMWIQYTDSRQTTGPSNFQHKGHIGFNSASGSIDFGDVSTLPEEFRKLAEASASGQGIDVILAGPSSPHSPPPVSAHSPSPTPLQHSQHLQTSIAPSPVVSSTTTSSSSTPAPPPPPPSGGGGATRGPPSPPVGGGNAVRGPPVPPASNNTSTPSTSVARGPPPAPTGGGGAPPPPPPPPSGGGASRGPPPPPAGGASRGPPPPPSGGGGNLADQLASRGTQLKKVDPPAEGGGSLAEQLANRGSGLRKVEPGGGNTGTPGSAPIPRAGGGGGDFMSELQARMNKRNT